MDDVAQCDSLPILLLMSKLAKGPIPIRKHTLAVAQWAAHHPFFSHLSPTTNAIFYFLPNLSPLSPIKTTSPYVDE